MDTLPIGRMALIASTDGSVHVKNILVAGCSEGDGEDSDMPPMMTPEHRLKNNSFNSGFL